MGEEGAKVVSSSRCECNRPPGPKPSPWLVFPFNVKGNEQIQALYNICEPNNRSYRKHIPELSGKSYWQKHSHQGWLIVICDDPAYNHAPNWDFGDCFLWNPASLETIQLPSLLPFYHKPDEYLLIDCVLSSPPRTSTSTIAYPDNAADEPMVLLLFLLRERDNWDSDMLLVFSHPGDKQWKTKWVLSQDTRTNEFLITSLCCFKDKLYLMCVSDQHLEIDKGKLWDIDDDSLTLRPFEITNNTGYPWRGSDHINGLDFYMESSVELFKVEIDFNWRQDMKVFNSVVVWILDFASKELEEVTCLGDHVLFIGKNTRACCSASKLGLTSGCLYYTLPEDQGLYKFQVQSSGNSVILPCLKLPRPWFPSDWIMILDGRQQEEEEDCMGKAVRRI